eukprot:TRINITY_DN4310_c0_g1_i1.p1 TRINITY_DN4310_c0_g1~~TRINITY_DN4310_c0_g1_i1.p1  ORF type:complete len:272 (+),score=52.49 TRINITY_DN4310_c0_g1_i1:429-1244(+)
MKPYILACGEARHWYKDQAKYPPIFELLGSNPSGQNNVTAFFEPVLHLCHTTFEREFLPSVNRTYFLAFLVSNCAKERREIFGKLLNATNSRITHALGPCMNNLKEIEKKFPDTYEHIKTFNKDNHRDSYCTNERIFHHYKFGLVFENHIAEGYITEKIMEVFRAGAVPIHWGGGKYKDTIFNKKAYIKVEDFESIDACVEHILKVNEDPVLYQQYINEPPFVTGDNHDIFLGEKSVYMQYLAKHLRENLLFAWTGRNSTEFLNNHNITVN